MSFAGAIPKTASGGEIDVLDSSDFGTLTISKPLTIDGRAALATIFADGTDGIVVNAGAGDVVILRGLSITGTSAGGSGVVFQSGGALHVENSVISGFGQDGIDFEPVDGGRLFTRDVVTRSNGNAGVFISSKTSAPALATIVKTRAVDDSVGFLAGTSSKMTIYDSVASNDTDAGIAVLVGDTGAGEINVEGITLTQNPVGVTASTTNGSALVRLSKALVTGSTLAPTAVSGLGRILSFGNNRIVGGSVTPCVPRTVTLSPGTLSQGTVGVAYPSTMFSAMGALGGVSFVETGALPTGLTFTTGTLAGIPSQAGAFPITVTATDGDNCSATNPYSLVVKPAATPDGGTPDGGTTPTPPAKGCGCGTVGSPSLWLLGGFLFLMGLPRTRRVNSNRTKA